MLNLKKKIIMLLVFIMPFMLIVNVDAGQIKNGDSTLTVDGDDLTVNTTNESIVLIGNVVALYKNFQIKSQKLTYDQKIKFAKIEGKVLFTGDNIRAIADVVEFDLTKEFLTMSGNAEVTRGGQTIKGSAVTYDFKTGILKVKNAHLEIVEEKK